MIMNILTNYNKFSLEFIGASINQSLDTLNIVGDHQEDNRTHYETYQPQLHPSMETIDFPQISTTSLPQVSTSNLPQMSTSNLTQISTANLPQMPIMNIPQFYEYQHSSTTQYQYNMNFQ